ncbi:hypothetical protein U4I37_15970 [Stenotrophomonas maltophilia]|uniref:hypothetical protein n=1 Tax=Stenotrophomonas maltophilia TaxID=40324 RepID=UPI002ACD0E3C|nr:hypothetical protein [Stenotrophomonas maltophilia]MDZ5787739.1 hypothetical protein [Stenotrophomonas maltophilia]
MSTDKTLADVQPGGRVQVMPSDAARALLAAQYRDDGDKAKAIRINHKSLTDSDKRALRAIETALSALPSPGGQGDDLAVELLATELERDGNDQAASAIRSGDTTYGMKLLHAALRAITAALAARQPVGEPVTVEAVATVRCNSDGDHYIDWLTEGGIADLEVGDVLIVSDRAITDEDGSGEVYTAPPAQAVDLGLQLDRYDAGLLGDGGGGDVTWWQDYIRTELDRAHEFYQDQADSRAVGK